MKRLLTLFTLSLVLVACETQPVGVDTPDAQFAKGDNPNKPPRPPSGELITFEGDLIGGEEVAGCCPNAGPFPEYTMTLSGTFPPPMPGTRAGNVFMNNWRGRDDTGSWVRGYKVQFWWGEETGDYYFMEINGGQKEYNKRTRVLTVTYADEDMTVWHNGEMLTTVGVDFILTRAPTG
jgi:hypothetical protein